MPSFTVSADSRRLKSHGAHFVWLASVLAVIVLLLTFGVFGAAKSTAAQRAPVRGIYSYDVPVSNTPARRVGEPPPAAPHGSEATRASGQLRATATPLVSVVAAEGDLAGSIRNVNALGGTQNCVNCVIAGDATLSGSPASALNSVGPQPISMLEEAFGGTFKEVAGQAEIEQLLGEAGPGARDIVYGAREGVAGHVFDAVNQGGTIRFLDPQLGGPASFEGYSGFRFLWTNVP